MSTLSLEISFIDQAMESWVSSMTCEGARVYKGDIEDPHNWTYATITYPNNEGVVQRRFRWNPEQERTEVEDL